MWMRSRAQVSQMMVVLMIGILSPVIYSDDSSYPAEDPPSGKSFQQHHHNNIQAEQQLHDIQQQQPFKHPKQSSLPLRLEVVAILSDASNESLGLSKALGRALNSITSAQLSQLNELIPNSFPSSSSSSSSWQSSADLSSASFSDVTPNSSPRRNVTWRVRNFVISNYTAQKSSVVPGNTSGSSQSSPRQSTRSNVFSNVTTTVASLARSDSGGKGRGRGTKLSPSSKSEVLNGTVAPVKEEEPEGSFFSPNTMPILCEFLGRTKAVAIVNLIGDVGSERLLSLVSTSSALPLIGSAQYANPLQTLHKVSFQLSFPPIFTFNFFSQTLSLSNS
ncbi:unnamed protein product [Allacma fusca]|uniref:Uncharacterized protein n=1 Tax=Allacma fusca TaxID=39272 RepID=A0A8J2NW51_9HEXA|nr:unnamed protein product [Allacma fusca]